MVSMLMGLVLMLYSGWYFLTVRSYVIVFSGYEITKYKRFYRDTKVQFKLVTNGLLFIGLRIVTLGILMLYVMDKSNLAGMFTAIMILVAEVSLGIARYSLDRQALKLLRKVENGNMVVPFKEVGYEDVKGRMVREGEIGKIYKGLWLLILLMFIMVAINIYTTYVGIFSLTVWQLILFLGVQIALGYYMYFDTLKALHNYLAEFDRLYVLKSKQGALRKKNNRQFFKVG